VATVARAVHAAHSEGLIHRDLKPGNILVETGEDGRPEPFVVDFGIAREAAVAGQTVTGQMIGTPGYMSPEQARGETTRLDRRSDVFSLGAVLYQVLTGRSPFEGDSAVDSLVRVLESDPVPPRRLVPGLPRDLATIVLRCLEKDPDRRYGSARELAEDLDAFLDGRPIAARPPGLLRRIARPVRRHPETPSIMSPSYSLKRTLMVPSSLSCTISSVMALKAKCVSKVFLKSLERLVISSKVVAPFCHSHS
jgi:serine/threonine-protein kinase